jgi:hypothetical protein
VLLAAGVGLVVRYRWLFDDAFVYFRYVDHWLFLDSGLVANRGEYVEGFSSPLHCLVLAALRSLELSYPTLVTLLGCAAYLAFGYGLIVLNRRLSPEGRVLNLPLATLGLNYSTTSFFTSGLETPLEHVWAVWTALFLLHPRSRLTALAVATAPLVRPELALVVAIAGLHAWLRTRRFPWWLAGLALAANGAWLVFRITYYADLLPNTFYLKDDTQLRQGLAYLWDLLRPYHVLPLALALVGLLAAVARRAGSAALSLAPRLAMAAAALGVAAYVVRIGGGAVHYWYLSFAFPLFVCAFAGIPELALTWLVRRRRPLLEEAAVLVFGLGVLSLYPRQLDAHPLRARVEHRQVGVVNDSMWHRRHPSLDLELNRRSDPLEDLKAFAPQLAESGYEAITAHFWCRWIWKNQRKRVVHGFGLTDALLARTDAPETRPGHKPELGRFARQIVELSRDGEPGPGMYRRALAAGRAPDWVRRNLAAIEIIERKVYNRHAFWENLALALSFPRIHIESGDGDWTLERDGVAFLPLSRVLSPRPNRTVSRPCRATRKARRQPRPRYATARSGAATSGSASSDSSSRASATRAARRWASRTRLPQASTPTSTAPA